MALTSCLALQVVLGHGTDLYYKIGLRLSVCLSVCQSVSRIS